jgi:hypothetical protein
MSNSTCRNSLRPLLFVTALPLVLLAEDATSAHAGCLNVTGANGAGGGPHQAGGGGGPATAMATSTTATDPTCATATAGAGGDGGNGAVPPLYVPLGGAGGLGGPATSTATTKVLTGSALATATTAGGAGGIGGRPLGAGGAGGAANSTATASSSNGSASATATSTGGNGASGGLSNQCCSIGEGGDGGAAGVTSSATGGDSGTVTSSATATGGAGGFNHRAGGPASAAASADSTGSGQVQADASAFAGQPGGTASASANAQNRSGEVITTASAPGGTWTTLASALATAAVGSGNVTPAPTFTRGEVISSAIETTSSSDFGVGAMSAAYGGLGPRQYPGPLQYDATALFTAPKSETLYLSLLSDNFGQLGFDFDTLTLEVFVNGIEKCSQCTFSSLAGARAFFTAHPIGLGAIAAEESITIDYLLGYNSGTSATVGDGFSFTYDLATAPVDKALSTTAFGFAATPTSAFPEPSTWAMMLLGFVGLAFVGYRARVEPRSSKNVT